MTIQRAIELAIKGGWQSCDIIDDYNKIILTPTFGGMWFKNDPEEDGCHLDHYQIVLMPGFWRALGTSLGWKDAPDPQIYRYEDAFTWRGYMHNMIDHLADGGTIESFFNTLTE